MAVADVRGESSRIRSSLDSSARVFEHREVLRHKSPCWSQIVREVTAPLGPQRFGTLHILQRCWWRSELRRNLRSELRLEIGLKSRGCNLTMRAFDASLRGRWLYEPIDSFHNAIAAPWESARNLTIYRHRYRKERSLRAGRLPQAPRSVHSLSLPKPWTWTPQHLLGTSRGWVLLQLGALPGSCRYLALPPSLSVV